MANYYIYTVDGKLFIFSGVELDPEVENPFKKWYCENQIKNKYTKTSFKDISYGELQEPEVQEIDLSRKYNYRVAP
jgi:hypothetical protein